MSWEIGGALRTIYTNYRDYTFGGGTGKPPRKENMIKKLAWFMGIISLTIFIVATIAYILRLPSDIWFIAGFMTTLFMLGFIALEKSRE